MGSPKINVKDTQRDPSKEMGESYEALLKYAGPMYEMNRKYGMKYAQNEADIMAAIAPQIAKTLKRDVNPYMLAMEDQARESDVRAVEKYSTRLRDAMEAGDPETYELRSALNQRALEKVNQGGSLSASQRSDFLDNQRSMIASKGWGFGINDAMTESKAVWNAMEDKEMERLGWAQSQMNSSAGLGADPILAMLGKPGRGYNPMGVSGQAQSTSGGRPYDLTSSYFGSLHGGNASNRLNAMRYNQQSSDALKGGMFAMAGGIGGGWLAGRGA